jgi:hypothetical protein
MVAGLAVAAVELALGIWIVANVMWENAVPSKQRWAMALLLTVQWLGFLAVGCCHE